MNLLSKTITSLSFLLLTVTALAHQTFLVPEKFHLAAGERVNLAITSALAFPDRESGPARDRIAFVHVSVNGQKIDGLAFTENETYLNTSFTPENTGFAVAAMSSRRRSGEIEPAQAGDYLDSLGVSDTVKAAFFALEGAPALNRSYNKHTKTFFCVASCETGKQAAYEPVGQKLEFVASREAANRFVLLLDGKPLAGHKVTVVVPGAENLELHSNPEGAIEFDTSNMRSVMLNAVWVTLPERPAGVYQSDYATLTLDFSL